MQQSQWNPQSKRHVTHLDTTSHHPRTFWGVARTMRPRIEREGGSGMRRVASILGSPKRVKVICPLPVRRWGDFASNGTNNHRKEPRGWSLASLQEDKRQGPKTTRDRGSSRSWFCWSAGLVARRPHSHPPLCSSNSKPSLVSA
jgi:hypothetical protein